MNDKIEIRTGNLEGVAPLYWKYPGQCNSQPAYIELDKNGVVTAETSEAIGNSMSSDQFNGCSRVWYVNSAVKGSALKSFLENEETIKLLQEVYDGLEIDWNGSNWVGHLTGPAQLSSEDIGEKLLELEEHTANIFENAAEYLDYSNCDVTAQTTDAELEKMAAYLEEEAEENDCIVEGILEWLTICRDRQLEELED